MPKAVVSNRITLSLSFVFQNFFKPLCLNVIYRLSSIRVVYLLICVIGSLQVTSPDTSPSSPYFRRHCVKERWESMSSRVGVETTWSKGETFRVYKQITLYWKVVTSSLVRTL